MERAQPVAQAERIVAVDIVRGFALLGVLLMNNQYQFRAPSELLALTRHPYPGATNLAADWILRVFVEAKAVTLFSFLFGMGLAIQLERATARGAHFGRYAARRLGALFVFGFLHVLLLWWGDVLHIYAVLGCLLLLFLRRRPRTILAVALPLVVLPAFVLAFWPHGGGAGPPMPSTAAAFADEAIRVYRQGSWLDGVPFRFRHALHHFGLGMAAFLPWAFGLFLLGLWTWRRGIVQTPEAHRTLLRRVVAVGLVAGLGLTVLDLVNRETHLLGRSALSTIVASTEFGVATPLLALSYGAGLLLLSLRPGPRRWLAPLAPVGRMALTNYLLQSLIMTWIMNGYGLGLYAKLGPAAGAILALGVFAAQMIYSRLWLARFRFGPAEWLWRTLTYGELQPLGIARAAPKV